MALQTLSKKKYWLSQKPDKMASYKLSNEAKEDLIRIHQYEIARFGEAQADKYFDSFFSII